MHGHFFGRDRGGFAVVVGRLKKVQEGSRQFRKAQEGSGRFKELHEGSGRCTRQGGLEVNSRPTFLGGCSSIAGV